MNKKAQLPILSIFFGLVVFIILWAMFFGNWLNEWANFMIVNNSLTGLEAFLIAYINVWVFLGVIISIVVSVYFGG